MKNRFFCKKVFAFVLYLFHCGIKFAFKNLVTIVTRFLQKLTFLSIFSILILMNRPIILPKQFHTPKKLLWQFLKIFLVLILIFWGFLFWKWSQAPHFPLGSPSSLMYCYSESATGTVTDWDCIKKTAWIILDSTSTKDFMDFLTSSGAPVVIQNNCHAIAHVIGAMTFDRSTGMESALATCSNTCGAGCIHGVIGAAVLRDLGEPYSSENIEHASIATIEKIWERYCKNGNPMCHAVGHILYISTQSFTGATQSCENISTGEHRESCYNWVFMQGAGGESEWLFSDPQSPQKLVDDLSYPCSLVQDDQLHACFHYLPLVQSQLFKLKNLHDSQVRDHMANQVCEKFPMPGRADCFEWIWFFADNTVFAGEDQRDIDIRCERLQSLSDRMACTRGVVWNYMYRFEYSPLIAYCEKITEISRKGACYDTMFDAILDGENPKDPKDICRDYGSPSCLSEYARYMQEGA